MVNWKNKLLAFLHDPPSKALDIACHEEMAKTLLRQAGFSDEEAERFSRESDWAASAADRLPFPDSKKSGVRCRFDGIRNRFHHPMGSVTSEGACISFPEEFKSVEFAQENDQSIQPIIKHYGKIPDDVGEPSGERWRARFFAHWRLWQKHAAERDCRFAFLPADTRIPDHTIWTHIQVVSALAGCADPSNLSGPPKPAFLKVQIGPVQEFIAASRSIRDLWSGSYLLSWLMAAGLKTLSERAGPDAVIYPNLRGQPLVDLHWRKDLWNEVSLNGEKSIWTSLAWDNVNLLSSNLPNVFLAVVPAGEAAELGRIVSAAINAEWKRIGESVWKMCETAELTADEGAITQAERRQRFDNQVGRFLSISWQATPWPDTIDKALSLADGFDEEMPIQKARERVQAVIEMATRHLPVEHRDHRYYTDDSKTKLNNTGLAWSVILALNSWELDAVRQTRHFEAAKSGGWTAGTSNSKDALTGREEAVAGGKEWRNRARKKGEFWKSLFKHDDWLGAPTLIKRVWHLAYLEDVWDLQTGSNKFSMPDTRSLAAHDPFGHDDDLESERAMETDSSEKYYAVLALDGDEIGKWVSGEKTPPISTQLADYENGPEQRAGAKLYFEKPVFEGFLKNERPLSPSYHLQFSEALSNFALLCARPVVEVFDGRLIYSGGDDVLALVPADTALACAAALRAAFRGEASLSELLKKAACNVPASARRYYQELAANESLLRAEEPGFVTFGDKADYAGRPIPFIVPGSRAEVSVGIAIAHFKAPLQDVVRAARAAEKRAKSHFKRGAVALSLFKRSGEILEWGCKWGSGGLELSQEMLRALESKHLSNKFPHKVVELLEPYLLSKTGLSRMECAPEFRAAEVIAREFGHALDRQCTCNGDEKKRLAQVLGDRLTVYLSSIDPGEDERVRQVIGLCQTVAFANRTRFEEAEKQGHL